MEFTYLFKKHCAVHMIFIYMLLLGINLPLHADEIKHAYDQAVATDTLDAYNHFLMKYPESHYVPDIKAKKIVRFNQRMEQVQQTSHISPVRQPDNNPTHSIDDALKIYQEMGVDSERKKQAKAKEKEAHAALTKKCNYYKDSLRRYGEIGRWYDLDQDGNRFYLTEKEVESKRVNLERKYQSKCSAIHKETNS